MSLADKLAATRAASATAHSSRSRGHHGAGDRGPAAAPASSTASSPVGSPAPAFELASHDGRRIASSELLAGGPMVVSFFRGSW